jgi:hypothetical protein
VLSDIALSHTPCNLGPARNDCLGRLIGPDTAIFQARLFPERTGNLTRLDAGLLPPSPFVAGAVQGAVVDSTERHRELVACLAAERARLRIAKMMRVRRLTAAHKAGLLGDKSDVVLVPNSTGLRQGEPALVANVGGDLLAPNRSMWPEPHRGWDGPSGHLEFGFGTLMLEVSGPGPSCAWSQVAIRSKIEMIG